MVDFHIKDNSAVYAPFQTQPKLLHVHPCQLRTDSEILTEFSCAGIGIQGTQQCI